MKIDAALAALRRHASKATLKGMARFALPQEHALGVTMASLKSLAKEIGRDHALAEALWQSRWYEARLLATLIDDPAQVTAAQMERWCRDFDNWGICDTACFALFDRTPHAWSKVRQWSGRREEYVRRAAFALLWGLTVHDKTSGDAPFLRALPLVERAATDERHWVKKAVNMALRAVGKRSAPLNAAAVAVARRLAESPQPAPRWVGKDALRELTSDAVRGRLARRSAKSAGAVPPVRKAPVRASTRRGSG
jgi:3-methyladenine DNA glycosylase AlkD